MTTHLSCGIVGLPNVGKSTLFNALLRKATAAAANYPFCTIDPNVGVVEVEDPRLHILSKLSHSHKIVPATVAFVDIAGLVAGASQGEGLGNQFLANIRETDLILHVVRCFPDPNVIHVAGKVDPISDIEVINLELILADLHMAENIATKLEKQLKAKKEFAPVHATLQRAIAHLNGNQPLRSFSGTPEEFEHLAQYPFLTRKTVLYIANVDEPTPGVAANPWLEQVQQWAHREHSRVIPVCAKLEEELSQLSPQEAREFLASLGLQETGLSQVIKTAFSELGLITYLTTGEVETRAWTIRKGTCAQEAAGKIHSDLERGFIRAEVVTFQDMVTYTSRELARKAGKARSEGKTYIVNDGDVIQFYHN